LDVVDTNGIAIDRVTAGNALVGTRGTVFAGKKIASGALYKVRIQAPTSGHLWFFGQGRRAEERPRLLYPLLGDVIGGTDGSYRVEQGQEVVFPDVVGIDSPMTQEAVTGSPTMDPETVFVLLTKGDAVPKLVRLDQSEECLPIYGVASVDGDQNIEAWLDFAEITTLRDDMWTCGMLQFLVTD
jgi:hypothetical protein